MFIELAGGAGDHGITSLSKEHDWMSGIMFPNVLGQICSSQSPRRGLALDLAHGQAVPASEQGTVANFLSLALSEV